MANIMGNVCNVSNMYWNAIKVFTYSLECLSYVFFSVQAVIYGRGAVRVVRGAPNVIL